MGSVALGRVENSNVRRLSEISHYRSSLEIFPKLLAISILQINRRHGTPPAV